MIRNIRKLLTQKKLQEKALKHMDSIRETMQSAGYTIIRESITYYKKGEQVYVDTAYTHPIVNKSLIYLPIKIESKTLTQLSLHNRVATGFFKVINSPMEIHCSKCREYVPAVVTSVTDGKDKIHLQIICSRCKTYWGAFTIEEQGVK